MPSQLRQLRRWSAVHAMGLLLGAGTAVLVTGTMAPVTGTALASFAILLLLGRYKWQRSELLSLANGVTALRLLGIVWLAHAAVGLDDYSYLLASAGLLLLLSDAIDGWLARRYKDSSSLGGQFDEEVDAFFLLILCLIAVHTERLGLWILLPGGLRYGFVLVRTLLEYRRPTPINIRSLRARVLFVVMMLAMLTTFLPYPALYTPAVVIASVCLVISFLKDTWSIATLPAESDTPTPVQR